MPRILRVPVANLEDMLLLKRISRLLHHFLSGGKNLSQGGYFWWWLAAILLLGDVLFFPEFYETLARLKPGTRPLNGRELDLGRSVFQEELRWSRIRIDERAYLGPKQGHFFYVSGYLINGWGAMPDDIFIHELVHIWQFEQVGSAYIAWALRAQRSIAGYDYGGPKVLASVRAEGGTLRDFNYEQQADIIADGWRIENQLNARWGHGQRRDKRIYQAYRADLLIKL